MKRALRPDHLVASMLVLSIVAFFSCSTNQIAGGDVTDTGNATAQGVILTQQGTPSQETEVKLLPADFNPVRDSIIPDSCKDTTDNQGRFSFTSVPAQYCNLLAVSLTSGDRLLVQNLLVESGHHPAPLTVTLSKPGSLTIAIPDSAQADGRLMVVGTDAVVTLTVADILRGYATIDSLPSGALPSMGYFAPQQIDPSISIPLTVTTVSGDTAVQPSLLPLPWLQTAIGENGALGGAISTNGEFRIAGSGSDIFRNSDGFHFVYQRLAGDFELRARVLSFGAPLNAAQNVPKAGIMVRESLYPDSRHATVSWDSRNSNSIFHWRSVTSDSSQYHSISPAGLNLPIWLDIRRAGSMIYGQYSTDGVTWTGLDSVSMTLPDTVYMGMSVTSGDSLHLNTAVYDSISVR